MTALTIETTTLDLAANSSIYPPGYLKNIRKTYEKHHDVLVKLAHAAPLQNSIDSDIVDATEHRLLNSQARLLELSASMKASNLDEIRELLKLWHQVAINDVSSVDISLTDELILVIYNYFNPQAET